MVWHIDVLLAVWNREPGSGPGGTAEVARLAFESGVPVIVVDPEGSTPPRRLIEIDERGAGEVDDADCRRAGMFEEIFSTLFAIPIEADSEHSNGGEEPDKLLKGFLANPGPRIAVPPPSICSRRSRAVVGQDIFCDCRLIRKGGVKTSGTIS